MSLCKKMGKKFLVLLFSGVLIVFTESRTPPGLVNSYKIEPDRMLRFQLLFSGLMKFRVFVSSTDPNNTTVLYFECEDSRMELNHVDTTLIARTFHKEKLESEASWFDYDGSFVYVDTSFFATAYVPFEVQIENLGKPFFNFSEGSKKSLRFKDKDMAMNLTFGNPYDTTKSTTGFVSSIERIENYPHPDFCYDEPRNYKPNKEFKSWNSENVTTSEIPLARVCENQGRLVWINASRVTGLDEIQTKYCQRLGGRYLDSIELKPMQEMLLPKISIKCRNVAYLWTTNRCQLFDLSSNEIFDTCLPREDPCFLCFIPKKNASLSVTVKGSRERPLIFQPKEMELVFVEGGEGSDNPDHYSLKNPNFTISFKDRKWRLKFTNTSDEYYLNSSHIVPFGEHKWKSSQGKKGSVKLMLHNCRERRHCTDGTCYNEDKFCNGVKDCNGGSDEIKCDVPYTFKKGCFWHNCHRKLKVDYKLYVVDVDGIKAENGFVKMTMKFDFVWKDNNMIFRKTNRTLISDSEFKFNPSKQIVLTRMKNGVKLKKKISDTQTYIDKNSIFVCRERFTRKGNLCLHFDQANKMTWAEGEDHCEKLGGYMASYKDDAEKKIIADFVKDANENFEKIWLRRGNADVKLSESQKNLDSSSKEIECFTYYRNGTLVMMFGTECLNSLTPVCQTDPKVCPSNFIRHGHLCLHLNAIINTGWKNSKSFCEYLDGHPASFKTPEEAKLIKQFIEMNNAGSEDIPVWLGASDAHEEGNWTWIDGETVKPNDFLSWGYSKEGQQPMHDEDQNCLIYWRGYSGGSLGDDKCDLRYYLPFCQATPVAGKFDDEGANTELHHSFNAEFKLPCSFDFHYFPFGEQECSFSVSLKNNKYQYEFTDKNQTSLGRPGENYGEFLFSAEERLEEDDPKLIVVTIHLTNLYSYYLLTSITPCILMCLIAYFTLYFNLDAFAERITVSATALLTLVVLFTDASVRIVKTSYIKLIDVWFIGCLVFTAFIVSINSLVHYLVRNEILNSRLSKLFSCKLCRKCRRKRAIEEAVEEKDSRDSDVAHKPDGKEGRVPSVHLKKISMPLERKLNICARISLMVVLISSLFIIFLSF